MRELFLTLDDDEALQLLGSALDSPTRRRILRLVSDKSYSIIEIAKELNLALSTTSFHVKCLREAKLIKLIPSPNKKGNEKNVSQALTNIQLTLNSLDNMKKNLYSLSLPLGSYSNFDICSPCGLINELGNIICELDQPSLFHTPKRFETELLYFYKGYIEYNIPTYSIKNYEILSFTFSLELCAECPNYNNNWKSNITFWINDIEIATYHCKGDYGDRRGHLTPNFWPDNSTQYGFLKKIKIDSDGVYLDEALVNNITIDKLNLLDNDIAKLKIGFKPNSNYYGGVNIFGKKFGDSPQDIIVDIALKYKNLIKK